jgi:hypothetical protein
VYGETVVIGKSGGLANAFVYIQAGLEGKKFEPNTQATFEWMNVPPGDYTVAVRHEKLGKQEQQVHVAAAGSAAVNFTYRLEGIMKKPVLSAGPLFAVLLNPLRPQRAFLPGLHQQ